MKGGGLGENGWLQYDRSRSIYEKERALKKGSRQSRRKQKEEH